jgi:hypothetical protein
MQPVQRWLVRHGKRRFERELAEYKDPPEARFVPFFRRRPAGDRPQVFRSLVQVNFYPRSR